MNKRDELLKDIEAYTKKMYETAVKKNNDYTGGIGGYSNFTTVELLGVTDTERGIITRMTDKFTRIIGLTCSDNQNLVQESIEDTCLDLANYSLILASYIKNKGKVNGNSNS